MDVKRLLRSLVLFLQERRQNDASKLDGAAREQVRRHDDPETSSTREGYQPLRQGQHGPVLVTRASARQRTRRRTSAGHVPPQPRAESSFLSAGQPLSPALQSERLAKGVGKVSLVERDTGLKRKPQLAEATRTLALRFPRGFHEERTAPEASKYVAKIRALADAPTPSAQLSQVRSSIVALMKAPAARIAQMVGAPGGRIADLVAGRGRCV
jgi:hypothetical protein